MDDNRPPRTKEELVERLRLLRDRAGLSVRDLAGRSGAPSATIGGYLSGRHRPTAAQMPVFRRMLLELGVAEQDLDRWTAAVTDLRRVPSGPPPYRGLLSFDVQDAEWFFGRDDVTADLLTAVQTGVSPLVVVGPTGAGKSSVLRAGLLAGWTGPRAVITPGADPTAALDAVADTVRGADGLLVVDQFEELLTQVVAAGPRQSFFDALTELIATGTAVVLGLRADFYAAAAAEPFLLGSLRHRQVLIGPMSVEQVREAIVGPAARAGLEVDEDLIHRLTTELLPRDRSAGSLEAGALPLLSHVLLATWGRSKDGRLSLAGYLAAGGLDAAVQQSAEQVYGDLEAADRETVRRLFLRMVTLDEDHVVTRRRATVDDPAHRAVLEPFVERRLLVADETGMSIAHEVLLVAWPRLHDWVRADQAGLLMHHQMRSLSQAWRADPADGSALLRGSRLAAVESWLDTGDRHGELDSVQTEYLQASRSAETASQAADRRRVRTLRSIVAVAMVLALVAGGFAVFGLVSRAQAQDRRVEADQARDRALSRQVANSARDLTSTAPALAAQLALTAYRIAPTVEARSALLDATTVPTPTVSTGSTGPTALAVTADGRLAVASDAGSGALRFYDLTTADAAPVVTSATSTAHMVFSAAFSPDGARLATGHADGIVELWDVSTPTAPILLDSVNGLDQGGGIQGVVFAPDGSQLLVGGAVGAGGPLRTWAATTALSDPVDLQPDGVEVQAVAWSADGLQAAGDASGGIRFYRDGEQIAQVEKVVDGRRVTALAFTPDGRTLAAGDRGGAVVELDLSDPTAPVPSVVTFPAFTSWTNTLTYNNDGTLLAAGSSASVARVFRAADGESLAEFGHRDPVTGIAFGADDQSLLTVSTDGGFRSFPWPGPMTDLLADQIYYVEFAAGGGVLLTGSASGEPGQHAWDIADRDHPRLLWSLEPPPDAAFAGAITADRTGTRYAVALNNGQLQVLTAAGPMAAPVATAELSTGGTAIQWALTFSPDGRTLISGGDDNAVHLWDVADPKQPVELATLELGGAVNATSVSPDGRYLAVGNAQDGATDVQLYDLADRRNPLPVATIGDIDGYAYHTVWNDDGTMLAVAGADRLVRLYDMKVPTAPVALGSPLAGPTGSLYWVSFRPGSSQVITASTDGSSWIWDITDPAVGTLWAQLQGAGGSVWTAAFSPDGDVIAAGGAGRRARLWIADPEAAAAWVCSTVGAPIPEKDWAIYLPEQPYAPPC